jgi:hypothetical protein
MQLPLVLAFDVMVRYLAYTRTQALKRWPKPCPLCGAEGCATFLGFYFRVRVYCDGRVYHNIAVARFICRRLHPEVAAGTHRTFSLLPAFLIPYCPYALDLMVAVAEQLDHHAENVYQTTNTLANHYDQETNSESLNLYAATVSRIKHRLYEAMNKLNQLSSTVQKLIGWSNGARGWSALLAFINHYRSRLHATLSGACALAQDWFYLFQEGPDGPSLPYMQRDFLFGTASQKRV